MATEPRRQFGRYELQSRIGRGGMAETWRARLMGAAGVTKPVLIKKVLPEYANDEAFVSMFISEARISASLSHGAIAQVFDFGEVDGDYFLAMEFVDGQPLHRILKRALRSDFTSLPAPFSTFIALELCRGLHYAHTRTDERGAPLGIVHRDISPDNVLISYEGQVKIVDFGIAKARSLRSFDTAPGVVKGKYLFFSPEQARGEQVDARTDVWATGVVLFNMLCGRLPLEGPEYVVMHRLTSRQPLPRIREVRPDLPAALEAILQKALALKKEDRFESAHALGDALAGFLYRSAPRFSAMSVAYLLRELFGPDMAEEGRDTRVPPAFKEELSVWRTPPPMPRPTEIASPMLDEEPRTLQSGSVEAEDGEAEETPREAEGGLLQDGIGISTAVAGVAVLAVVGVLWLGLSRIDYGNASEARPSTGPPPSFRHVPPPAQVEAAAPKPSGEDVERAGIEKPRPLAARSSEGGRQPSSRSADTQRPETDARAPEPGGRGAAPPRSGAADSALSSARALFKAKKFEEARERARECVARVSDHPECHLLLGSASARLGEMEEGAKHYRRFLEVAPVDHPQASQVLQILQAYESH